MWKQPEEKRPALCVTPGFWGLLALGWAWGAGEVLPQVLLAALCHEGGHLLLLRLFGVAVEAVCLTAAGAEIRAEGQQRLPYGREILCVLAGPAVNVLLALVFARWRVNYVFAGANALLAAYNLLPIRNLDGGRALWLAVAWWSDPFVAERIGGAVNLAAMAALLGGAALILVRTGCGLFCLVGALGLALGQLLCRRKGKRGCQRPEKQVQ